MLNIIIFVVGLLIALPLLGIMLMMGQTLVRGTMYWLAPAIPGALLAGAIMWMCDLTEPLVVAAAINFGAIASWVIVFAMRKHHPAIKTSGN